METMHKCLTKPVLDIDNLLNYIINNSRKKLKEEITRIIDYDLSEIDVNLLIMKS
jgi:hypothetical protein